MRIWFNNVVDTQRRMVEVEGDRVRIGRGETNDLVLHSPYIALEAAVLYRRNQTWELVVLGMNGVRVGSQQLSAGEHRELNSSTTLEIFPYTLSLDLPTEAELTREAEHRRLDQLMSSVLAAIHRELLDRMDLRRGVDASKQADDSYQLSLERHLEAIASGREELASADQPLVAHLAGYAVRNTLLEPKRDGTSSAQQPWARFVSAVPEREDELGKTGEYLAGVLELEPEPQASSNHIEIIEQSFWPAWRQLEANLHGEFRRYLAQRVIVKEIKDIVFGLGPLEDLLRMPSISEIMVVDRDRIYVENNGLIEDSGRRFVSDEVVESIMQRIVGKVGRRIDKSQPLVDARLADGSRVNAVIAPLAVSGPTLTIRKFPARKILIHDLVALGALSNAVSDFLRAAVLARCNILVSGGTGSGKTTLLNCLSDFIPDGERIVTVEDTAELQLQKQHVVRLETKDANVEGAGEYTIRDLVRNALRMRPDRIVVGECRGAEALDMLQAMNTGHDGSLTTIHANNARDVTLRLEVLVQMAADLPIPSIRSQVGSAIDLIVQLERQRDGRRVITQVTECVGVDRTSGELELRDLYMIDEASGSLEPTGQLPSFIMDLLAEDRLQIENFYSVEAGGMLIGITSGMLLVAVALGVGSTKPCWDRLASSFVQDQVKLARALMLEEERIQFGLRIWGCALVANLFVIGFCLGMLPVACGLAVLLLLTPRWIMSAVIRRRRNVLRDQMVGCTRALANSARAGQSLTQALASVADDSPFPLSVELQRIVSEYELGRPMAEALSEARTRLKLDSFSLFASSIVVSLQRGGRITEALERICRSLQENQRIERKLAAETASGWRVVLILTAFPFLFLLGFAVLYPVGTSLMFETLIGQLLLLTILALVVASLWWSRKILTIEL